MGENWSCPGELRTLFLFEKLSDEQLQTLCDNGHIATFEPRPGRCRGRARHLLLRAARR